jgi:hypothetical protein
MRPPSRRLFLRSLAAVPVASAAAALAQVPSAPSPSPAPPAASPAPPGDEARALAEAVRSRLGTQVGAEDMAAITSTIDDNLKSAERLHKGFRLGNGDEPITTFIAAPVPSRPGGQR